MNFHFSIELAAKQLTKEEENRFTVLMKHGTMSIEYYAPKSSDLQNPHNQDEVYVIVSGKTEFIRNGERAHCKAGDVLFVPAQMEHRFENFSDDFATWVIFFGKQGGESS
jgi:mannose-6-phosphate isomerase-like protein (cupin superfamily)